MGTCGSHQDEDEKALKYFLRYKNLENVELNVCSSTVIYGKKFNDNVGKNYENIFVSSSPTK